jgi:hypothetical protein
MSKIRVSPFCIGQPICPIIVDGELTGVGSLGSAQSHQIDREPIADEESGEADQASDQEQTI